MYQYIYIYINNSFDQCVDSLVPSPKKANGFSWGFTFIWDVGGVSGGLFSISLFIQLPFEWKNKPDTSPKNLVRYSRNASKPGPLQNNIYIYKYIREFP